MYSAFAGMRQTHEDCRHRCRLAVVSEERWRVPGELMVLRTTAPFYRTLRSAESMRLFRERLESRTTASVVEASTARCPITQRSRLWKLDDALVRQSARCRRLRVTTMASRAEIAWAAGLFEDERMHHRASTARFAVRSNNTDE